MESTTTEISKSSPAYTFNITSVTEISWTIELLVAEVTNVTVLAATLWVVLCTIVYGTKTKRWFSKGRSSSLKSGAVFTVYVISTALTLPGLIITEYLFVETRKELHELSCTVLIKATSVSYIVFFYSVFLFIWIMQRRIYNHGYVKERISRKVNFLSRFYMVVPTVLEILAITGNIISTDHFSRDKSQGCVATNIDSDESIGMLNLISVACSALIYVTTIFLSLYPAFKARFFSHYSSTRSANDSVGQPEALSTLERGHTSVIATRGETAGTMQYEKTGTLQRNYSEAEVQEPISCCRAFFFIGSRYTISPIQAVVKRAAICSIIVGASNICAHTTSILLPKDIPLPFYNMGYVIGNFIAMIAALTTFGFTGQVLTAPCSGL